MNSKVWDEITYLFPNSNGANRWSFDTDKYFIHTYFSDVITYSWWDYS